MRRDLRNRLYQLGRGYVMLVMLGAVAAIYSRYMGLSRIFKELSQ